MRSIVDTHKNYFSVFAELADALNPLKITNKAVLSLNPCDFLGMSMGDGWTSYFNLGEPDKRGKNIAGTLAFMNDSVSMIFYTVKKDTRAPYYNNIKIQSQVFCYENGILLQSRLYPKHSDEKAATTFRNLVQQIFSVCLEQPNLWLLKKRQPPIESFYKKAGVLKDCYNLFNREYSATSSLLKSKYPKGFMYSSIEIVIGNDSFCVNCGNTISSGHKIYCDSCTE